MKLEGWDVYSSLDVYINDESIFRSNLGTENGERRLTGLNELIHTSRSTWHKMLVFICVFLQ